LGVALVRSPRLLLLDEPHAGLDTEGRAALDTLVGDAADAGCTVVLASHELDRARTLASREVVLTGGQAHGAIDQPRAERRRSRSRTRAQPDAREPGDRSRA
jgi:ABC-type multidrug transport system ATPase subunit